MILTEIIVFLFLFEIHFAICKACVWKACFELFLFLMLNFVIFKVVTQLFDKNLGSHLTKIPELSHLIL